MSVGVGGVGTFKPEESIRFSAIGVTGGRELFNMGAGKQTCF